MFGKSHLTTSITSRRSSTYLHALAIPRPHPTFQRDRASRFNPTKHHPMMIVAWQRGKIQTCQILSCAIHHSPHPPNCRHTERHSANIDLASVCGGSIPTLLQGLTLKNYSDQLAFCTRTVTALRAPAPPPLSLNRPLHKTFSAPFLAVALLPMEASGHMPAPVGVRCTTGWLNCDCALDPNSTLCVSQGFKTMVSPISIIYLLRCECRPIL